MKAKGNYTPTQLEFIERIRRSAAISSRYGEIYAPEDGDMPRLVYPAKIVDGLEAGFKGEVLDIPSRAAVRSVVTGFVKSYDLLPDRPGDISYSGRRYLILKCKRKLEQKERKKGGDALCWSVQAIAEEIDYYLPKSFMCFRIRKKSAPAKTVVDPDSGWMSEEWCWMFPDTTPDRLKAEYMRSRKSR